MKKQYVLLIAIFLLFLGGCSNYSQKSSITSENTSSEKMSIGKGNSAMTNSSNVEEDETIDSSITFKDFNGNWFVKDSESSIGDIFTYISDEFYVESTNFEEFEGALDVYQIENRFLTDDILTLELQQITEDDIVESDKRTVEIHITNFYNEEQLQILNTKTGVSLSLGRKEIPYHYLNIDIQGYAEGILAADEQGEGQKNEKDPKSYSNEIDELWGSTYTYTYDGGTKTYSFNKEMEYEEGPILICNSEYVREWDGEINARGTFYNIKDIQYEDNIYYVAVSESNTDEDIVYELYRTSENELLNWNAETSDYTETWIKQ